jgi:3-methyladenine DNA glycosylase/8-oxoguanine DNA glycosylase
MEPPGTKPLRSVCCNLDELDCLKTGRYILGGLSRYGYPMQSKPRVIPGLPGSQLAPILLSHGWINLAPAERLDFGFRYSLSLDTLPLTVDVTCRGKDTVYQVDAALTQTQRGRLVNVLGHALSLDFPIRAFAKRCRELRAPILRRLSYQGWGRMLRSPTLWEDAAKTLCTTNASWGHTQKMCQNLCEQLGGRTASGRAAFPSAQAVIRAGETFIRNKIGLGYRSPYLIQLAHKAVSGEVRWLDDYSETPDAQEAERQISAWHGFGPYATKHLLVLMGFHRYLPVDREVADYLGTRRSGARFRSIEVPHYREWGEFRFTAYKLERVAKKLNWIGD